jgi:demethylmenaquinone methyltransferase / 2-methoxy-6-polyprenyl-1,4-benzoquinol methylase
LAAKQTIPDAQAIFDGVAENYERPARIFGLGQYDYWHRELAGVIAAAEPKLVLDMCTGTGLVARELRRQTKATIVGTDLSRAMLAAAKESGSTALVQADAQRPPFADTAFDAVAFSYLLRYVEDVPGTVQALGRLVRSGGRMASLEFGVPSGLWKPAWTVYTRAVLPAGLSVVSPGWRRVGQFLGRSIADFYRRWPVERQAELWQKSGFEDVRTRSLSLGGGFLIWGTRS